MKNEVLSKEKMTPCFWYNGNAAEAATLYCSVFANAKIVSRSPIVTEINVSGQNIILLDGGPMYQPNPSISFYYVCENMAELDRVWATLSKEGTVMMGLDKYPWSEKYGWLADKYGISWQISLGKMSDTGGQKITPAFMFTGKNYGKADEAIIHYTSIFKNSGIEGILRYGANEKPDEEGRVKHAQIKIEGQTIMLMESAHAHHFTFSEGVSLTIHCENQEEIDYYWEKLTEGGAESMCGWLKDRYGVSWQIIPTMLGKIMSDPAKAGKAAQAFMGMRKIIIEQIVQASIA